MKAQILALVLYLGIVNAKPLDNLMPVSPSDINVAAPPVTVSSVDLPNYLGRWYQMYANRFVFSTFERDNVCVTADYGLNLDGTVSVENNARLGSPESENSTVINGFAYMPDPKEPAKLAVIFPSVGGPPGEYWIIKLGPLEESYPSVPLYQYAVVTDSNRLTLFVLARNVQEFNARFKDEVLSFIEEEGFTRFYNAPKQTVQTPDCKYAGVPSEEKSTSTRKVEMEDLDRILFRTA
ncbi:uncharacterized protein [Amphiura filiformis]|uniref:uncharacterized protein n=1 Tax=Amphiura filiformis TaxID=82378 RepID=UPI003B223A1C